MGHPAGWPVAHLRGRWYRGGAPVMAPLVRDVGRPVLRDRARRQPRAARNPRVVDIASHGAPSWSDRKVTLSRRRRRQDCEDQGGALCVRVSVSQHLVTIPAAMLDDPAIGPHALRLALVLSDYANREGYCWPSLATLAKRTGTTSKAGVHKHLTRLVRLGYVKRVKGFQTPTGATVTAYALRFTRRRRRSLGANDRSPPANDRSLSVDGSVRSGRTMEVSTTEPSGGGPKSMAEMLGPGSAWHEIKSQLGPRAHHE